MIGNPPLRSLFWLPALCLVCIGLISSPVFAEVAWRESIAHPFDIFGFGNEANGNSSAGSTLGSCTRIASDDGRYVVFSSDASNLVRGDTNNVADVFLRDSQSDRTQRISVSNTGEELDSDSLQPCISADGRYVTYQTKADVTGEVNSRVEDVYLYDRIENTTTLVSAPQDGCTSCDGRSTDAAISGDGNWIAFRSTSEHLGLGDLSILDQIILYERASGAVELISAAPTGEVADQICNNPTISDDGRFVAFSTRADNLGVSVNTFTTNVFLYDTVLETMALVSKSSDGTTADDDSRSPRISGNGQVIVYTSEATNLVEDDTNENRDVFVYRLGFESVERVSIASDGTEGTGESRIGYAHISADGNTVAFVSNSPELAGLESPIDYTVFVHDRLSRQTTPVGEITAREAAAELKRNALLTPDGQALWLISDQSDWVANDGNGAVDIFSVERVTGNAMRVSMPNRNFVGPSGANAPSDELRPRRWISNNGRWVVFSSTASNLVDGPIAYPEIEQVFVLDRLTRDITRIAEGQFPSISDDGEVIVFASEQSDLVPDDSNGVADIFVYRLSDGSFERASVGTLGEEATSASGAPYLSAGGRYVVFEGSGTDLVPGTTGDIIVRDLSAATTLALSSGSGENPTISADGRYVAFSSRTTDLIPNDTNGEEDVFVWDTILDIVRRVSVSSSNVQSEDDSEEPMISDDGNHVVFFSFANDLIDGATTSSGQSYLHEISTGVTELVSVDGDGDVSDWTGFFRSVSMDGRYVAFTSGGSNLAAPDQVPNGRAEDYIFLHDRTAGLTRRVDTDRFDTLGRQENGRSRMGTVSEDGRFILASSGYLDLHLDAGRYGQTDAPANYQPFLVELSGFAEPTVVTTIDLATLNAEVGAAVTIPIIVTGETTAVLDGVASIDAETGETCLQTDRAMVMGQPAARRFECEITFRSAGEHELSLGLSVSETHESSALLVPISVTRPADDPNQPPTAESQTLTVTPDTPRPINLLASDPDGDPLTFVLASPPSHGVLSGTPPNVTYTPDMGFMGEDSFVFGVTDGLANSGPAIITLLISDTPVPVADSQTQQLDEDTDLLLTLTGSASDMGPLGFVLDSDPQSGTLIGALPDVTYVPEPNFFGVDSFVFRVLDSTGTSEPATVTLIVDPVNDPPSFTPGPNLIYPAGSSGTQTEFNWATDILPGPMEMDLVSFALTPTDASGVLQSITLSSSGTLQIVLTGNAGAANVEVVANDSAGASSAASSFTVTLESDVALPDVIFENGFEE